MANDHGAAGRRFTLTRKQLLAVLGGGALAGSASRWLPAAAAQQAGVLKVSFRNSLVRLDPAFTISGDEYIATQAIYDNLTRLDEALQTVPALAERWESPDDGVTWDFTLRSGVQFHHGRALEAADVVFSFERILDPATGSPGGRAVGPIARVSAPRPNVVRFVLKGPLADFPTIMAGTFGRIVPRDAGGELNRHPIGTGPFRFVEWVSGQHLRLARNDSYWMPGLPALKEVWLVTYPAQAAEQSALAAGEVQVMWDVPLSLVPAVSGNPQVRVSEIPSGGFQPVAMRCDRPPFNDPRVRRAVKHAINRDLVMRIVLQGHGTIAQDSPVPPTSPFFSNPQAPAYDVAQARKLLGEAGFANGFPIRLFASNERSGCVETAQVIKPMLEAVGIKTEIQQVPWDRFNAEVWKKESLFVGNWLGRTTVDEQLYPFYYTGGVWNEYNFSDPEIDRQLDQARQELDGAKRRSLYAAIQQKLALDGPAIIPYFSNYATARAKSLEGVPVSAFKWLDLREARLTG